MLPGPSKIVKCPKCGKEMHLFQLASGNTLGARFWSDGKISGPMLWMVSPITQCEACGSYYRNDNQPERYAEDDFWGSMGVFDYEELKAAKVQFEAEGASMPENFPILLVQAYNDKFLRSWGSALPTPTAEDKQYIGRIIDTLLLDSEKLDPIFVAELLRETERFEECIEQLERWEVEADAKSAGMLKEAAGLIKEAAKAHYSLVFNLKEPPLFQ